MVRRSSLFVSLLLAAAALGTGCAPQLRLRVLEPAPVNFGAANHLAIVQSEGRRSAREEIIQETLKQARGAGLFGATDRTEEGFTLKVVGRTGELSGGQQPLDSNDIAVRLDVYDWNADQRTETVTRKDSKGKKYQEQITYFVSKVVIGVTAVSPKGVALLAEREYQATGRSDSEETALRQAGAMVVSYFLRDITPRVSYQSVRMDDSDEAQKPFIETAAKGNLEQAITDMRGYLERSPGKAAAQYNLAVLLDAAGAYEEALALYDQALRASPKDFYATARAACARRMASQQALAE